MLKLKLFQMKERLKPEVNRLFGDNSLLKQLTDWEPKFSALMDLKMAWQLQLNGSQRRKI